MILGSYVVSDNDGCTHDSCWQAERQPCPSLENARSREMNVLSRFCAATSHVSRISHSHTKDRNTKLTQKIETPSPNTKDISSPIAAGDHGMCPKPGGILR